MVAGRAEPEASNEMNDELPISDLARQPKGKIFISYSRKDMAFVDQLEAALKARGFEPLIDRTDIYAFEEWWKRIEALIGQADTVVFVLSPDAVQPGTVALKEVAFAASLNKRFAPIIFRPLQDKFVPEELAKLNFIFFEDASRFEQSADKLAEALDTDIAWIRQHTEYGEAEPRWSTARRPSGLLLHSPTLEVAEHWIVTRPRGVPEPTREIKKFIAASRKSAQSAQRVRRVMLASTFTFMAASIFSLVGWINQDYLKEQIHWFWTLRPYRVANVDSYVLKPGAERALKPGDTFRECANDCPEMIVLPAGEFMMGGYGFEGPQHKVLFAKPFAVSKFEITFKYWDACVAVGRCGQYRPPDEDWGRATRPVIYVNWDDAQSYVAWFSKMTGQIYRLLSEAEWEYAARAGTQTVYSWGDQIGIGNANCDGCRSKWDNRMTAPVGSFKSNPFGLYDMHGNVWEWVQDCYEDYYNGAPTDGSARSGDCSNRVVRGGSWFNPPNSVRSGKRDRLAPGLRFNSQGFRIARTITFY